MITPLITVAELAAATGLRPHWIREQARMGRMPCRCFHGMYRFVLVEVEEWIESHYLGPPKAPAPQPPVVMAEPVAEVTA